MKIEHRDAFTRKIYDYYRSYGRSFLWRQTDNAYHIVVSEIMLQQTQTYRVVPKFEQFIAEFSNIKNLAQASLAHILNLWQGLGYNRRAKALHAIAQRICNEFNDQVPDDPVILETFPGIGYATACSIAAFAYNRPTVFIETNIRAVFIHEFFANRIDVHDKEIMPLIEETLDKKNARYWYYALMDYGVMLKKSCSNPNKRSKHYVVQSKFEGSNRQIRGAIIRILTHMNTIQEDELYKILAQDKRIKAVKERSLAILHQLIHEEMVMQEGSIIFLVR